MAPSATPNKGLALWRNTRTAAVPLPHRAKMYPHRALGFATSGSAAGSCRSIGRAAPRWPCGIGPGGICCGWNHQLLRLLHSQRPGGQLPLQALPDDAAGQVPMAAGGSEPAIGLSNGDPPPAAAAQAAATGDGSGATAAAAASQDSVPSPAPPPPPASSAAVPAAAAPAPASAAPASHDGMDPNAAGGAAAPGAAAASLVPAPPQPAALVPAVALTPEGPYAASADPSLPASGASGAAALPPPAFLSAFLQRLRDLRAVLVGAVEGLGRSLDTWWARMAVVVGVMCVIVTAVVNAVLVPVVNASVLPAWEARAAQVLQREVSLGRIHWVGLEGVSGMVPLLRMGPVVLGPGPVERSSLEAPSLSLYLDPLQSLLYKQAALRLHAEQPHVTIVQGPNFSWVGYPEDTLPESSRDFLPGLKETQQQENGTGAGTSGGQQKSAGGAARQQGELGAAAAAAAGAVQEQQQEEAAAAAAAARRSKRSSKRAAKQQAAAEAEAQAAADDRADDQQQQQQPAGEQEEGWQQQQQPEAPSEPAQAGAGNRGTEGPEATAEAAAASGGTAASSSAAPPQPHAPEGSEPPAHRNHHHHRHHQEHAGTGDISHAKAAAAQPSSTTSAGAGEAGAGQAPTNAADAAERSGQPASITGAEPTAARPEERDRGKSGGDPENGGGKGGSSGRGGGGSEPPFASLGHAALVSHGRSYSQPRRAATAQQLELQRLQEQLQQATVDLLLHRLPIVDWLLQPVDRLGQLSSQLREQHSRSSEGVDALAQVSGAAPAHAGTSQLQGGTATAAAAIPFQGGWAAGGTPCVADVPRSLTHSLAGTSSPQQAAGLPAALRPGARRARWAQAAPRLQPAAVQQRQSQQQEAGALPSGAYVADSRGGHRGHGAPVASVAGAVSSAGAILRGEAGADDGSGRRAGDHFVEEFEDSLPPVALAAITLRNASVEVFIIGERLPRRFEYVNAALSLGRHYRSLDLALEGDAHERAAESAKCTMINAAAKRHLRHVTPGASTPTDRLFACDTLPGGSSVALQHAPAVSELATERATQRAAALRSGSGHQRPHHGGAPSQAGQSVQDGTEHGDPQQGGQAPGGGDPVALAAVAVAATPGSGDAGGDAAGAAQFVARYSETVRPQRSKSSQQGPEPETYTLHTYGLLLPRQQEGEEGQRQAAGNGAALDAAGRAGAPAAGAAAEAGGVARGPGPGAAAGRKKARGGAPADLLRPAGGRLQVTLSAKGMGIPNVWPDLSLSVQGEDLHGPLIERLLELPMDIHAGRAQGELRLRCFDTPTWQFPELSGRIKCRGVDLHFWDSPDDILGADMDLVLERSGRMYLHGASGHFGAVPITITGDMDLNPSTGTYRLQSSVPGVEANALRATLGVRPIPFAVSGAVRGVLHCTGPLERPIFSGTAVAMRPSASQLDGSEHSLALDALLGCSGAVAAYDKVPLLGAQGVFTLDMATQMFNLHTAQVQPVGGGSMLASGRMWVAPQAESDPRAITMLGEAQAVDADLLAKYYLPPDMELPPGALSLGRASVRATMAGSHLAPVVELQAEAPDARLSGAAVFSQTAISVSAKSPAFVVDGTLLTSLPHIDKLRASNTQAEATFYARPRFCGADLDARLLSPDLLPLATGPTVPPFDPLAANQPLRCRLAGQVRLALRPRAAPGGSPAAAGTLFEGPISLSGARINSLELVRGLQGTLSLGTSGPSDQGHPAAVDTRGPARRNNSRTPAHPGGNASTAAAAAAGSSRSSSGSASSVGQVALRARGGAAAAHGPGGARSGEADLLELELAVPDLLRMLNIEGPQQAPPPRIYTAPPAPAAGALAAAAAATNEMLAAAGDTPLPLMPDPVAHAASGPAAADRGGHQGAEGRGGGPVQVGKARAAAAAAEDGGGGGGGSPGPGGGPPLDSRLLLRRGPLLLQAEVLNGGGELFMQVANLQLDELEVGSLRGRLAAGTLAADVAGRRGRASLALEGMRVSSLEVGAFGGSVRWEGDIVKLEDTVLVQAGSRYEFSGEVFLPGFTNTMLRPAGQPGAAGQQGAAAQAGSLARQAAEDASRAAGGEGGGDGGGDEDGRATNGGSGLGQRAAGASESEAEDSGTGGAQKECRWRLQVVVPSAQIQDLLPAVQLASSTTRPGLDYGQAKEQFLQALHAAAGAAGAGQTDVRLQVDAFGGGSDGQQQQQQQQQQAGKRRQHRGKAAAGKGAQAQGPAATAASGAPGAAAGARAPGGAAVPLLQELSGNWSGRMQVYGSLAGAHTIDFSLLGSDWCWGSSYRLDRLVAAGQVDSGEGVALEELTLVTGPARLHAAGTLLCARQDARLALHDFPLDLLQPLYRALPALGNAAAAAEARGSASTSTNYLKPLSGLAKRLDATLQNLGIKPPGADTEGGEGGAAGAAGPGGLLPASPLWGRLNLEGRLSGSTLRPQAGLEVRVEEGGIGGLALGEAQASFAVDAQQRISVALDLAPRDASGYLRLQGSAQVPASVAARLQRGRGRGSKAAGAAPATAAAGPAPAPASAAAGSSTTTATALAKGGPAAEREAASGSREDGMSVASSQLSGSEAGNWSDDESPSPSLSRAGTAGAAALQQGAAGAPPLEQGPPPEEVALQLQVRDGGIGLLCALLPECEWQSGSAAIDLKVHGKLDAPSVEGSAVMTRGSLLTPVLRNPITNINAIIEFDGSTLHARQLEAKLGRQGSLRAHGALQLQPPQPSTAADANAQGQPGTGGFPQQQQGAGAAAASPRSPAWMLQDAARALRAAGPGVLGGGAAAVSAAQVPSAGAASPATASTDQQQQQLVLEVEGADVRARGAYSGLFDARLVVRQSLMKPVLGGSMRFSRGVAYLMPQGSAPPTSGASGASAAAGTSQGSAAAAGAEPSVTPLGQRSEREVVRRSLAALKAGRKRALLGVRHGLHSQGSVGHVPAEAAPAADMSNLLLSGLEVALGPDLRAIFPVVLSLGLSGQVVLSGPADPQRLQPSGTITLESCSLNLVATQFTLDREHNNRIVFTPQPEPPAGAGGKGADVAGSSAPGGALDPLIDVVLVSGDLRASIQGRGSAWQEGLQLTASGMPLGAAGGAGGAGGGSSGGDPLVLTGGGAGGVAPTEPGEVARILEDRLTDALLGENGQLALRSLARNTFSSLLPRIETRGQVGRARWRLVGAPSLPSLLSLPDPVAEPSRFLSALALGTEVEVALGRRLQASLSHKLQELGRGGGEPGGGGGTQARVSLQLSRNLRLQAHLARGLLLPSITLQYSSEGMVAPGGQWLVGAEDDATAEVMAAAAVDQAATGVGQPGQQPGSEAGSAAASLS